MATVTFIKYQKQSAGAVGGVARYVSQEEKTRGTEDRRLVSGQNCAPQLADREFIATREAHRKESPTWFYHYVQSFSPEEKITGEQAHELAQEFAAKAWPDSEVLIATHTDAEHIHSHFVVNAVCWESGKMLRQGPNTLRTLRALSDELCVLHGFSVLPQEQGKKKVQSMGTREYRSAVKGESWKFRLMNTIDQCMRYAETREDFISLMESEGCQVRWTEGRKNITYTTPEGRKCRDDRLHDRKYTKEVMEHEFGIRTEIVRGRTEEIEPAIGPVPTGHATGRSHPAGLGGSAEHAQRPVPAGEGNQRPAGAAGGQRRPTGGPVSGFVPTGRAASHPGAGGGAGAGCGPNTGPAATGWEKERETVLQMAGLAPGLRPDRSGQMDRAGVVHRSSAAGAGVRHGDRDQRNPGPAPLSPLHAGLYGLAAAGTLLDEDGDDAEERSRRAQAEQEAKNIGVFIGLVAGAVMALAHAAGEPPEAEQVPEEPEEQTWEQTMQ